MQARHLIALLLLLGLPLSQAAPIVIAHRGASGYLPEHTLETKALAHAMGADYIEQDVVLTRDGVPIVLHDIYLDATTDVAVRFPERAREDGRYYALDFDLREIRQLRVHERSQSDASGIERAVYPGRFPLHTGTFRLPALREEIELIAGLDRSRSRTTGLYVELKAPNWHAAQGYDLAQAVLSVLEETGYAKTPERVFLQCFDDATLRRLHTEFKTGLPLIQLIAENEWGEDSRADYDAMRTPEGLAHIARYASGIGPWVPQVLAPDASGELKPTGLIELAHREGLLVHPYTLRKDELPEGADSLEDLHQVLFLEARADGAFSDFPDLTRGFLDREPPPR